MKLSISKQVFNSVKLPFIALPFIFLMGCSSHPIIPDSSDIKVGRKAADSDCTEIGLLRGSSLSATASKEEVLEDLKKTAANKGATYIKIEQFSETGTSVTGMAYNCN